jgi:hypothetical protein
MNLIERYVIPLDPSQEIRKIADDDDTASQYGDNVVEVHPADEKGVRRIELEQYYDNHGVFALVTTAPLDWALNVMRAAIDEDIKQESKGWR